MKRFLMAAMAGCLALSCSGRKPVTGPTPNRLRNVITRDEIEVSAQREMDLYTAIRGLRPHFFAAPPGIQRASNDAELAVYVDRIRQNGVVALRSISARSIDEVRYLDPTTSQN